MRFHIWDLWANESWVNKFLYIPFCVLCFEKTDRQNHLLNGVADSSTSALLQGKKKLMSVREMQVNCVLLKGKHKTLNKTV